MTFRKEGHSNRCNGVCIALFAAIMIICLSSPSEGANSTTAGIVSGRSADATSIQLTMPYTGDDNGSNTYTIDYKTCVASTWTNWVTNAPHSPSLYTTAITDLINNQCYSIRATYFDSDGISGRNPQTIQISAGWDNTLLHNSNRFPGTTKWSGDWGTPTGQYSRIICETCHTRTTDNIKRLKDSVITSPNSPAQRFPAETGGVAPVFLSVTAPSGFGDDTGGHSSSQKVCEVCHSTASYHRYNTAGQTVLDHNNNTDCMVCHPHAYGFKSSCDTCHGNPPAVNTAGGPDGLANAPATGSLTAGAHSAHTAKSVACTNCHYSSVGTGATHRDIAVTLGFYLFDGAYQGGAYNGQTTANYNATSTSPATAVSKTGIKTCSTIYCHGSTMVPNNGTNTTPTWDNASTGTCGTCHGATAANPPVRGSHAKHAGDASALISPVSCDTCHSDNSHVNAKVEWKFGSASRVAGANYKGGSSGTETMGAFPKTYGTCTNLYCHSNASPAPNVAPTDPNYANKNEANTFKTVTWGGSSPMACDSCHRGKTADTLTMKSNGHYKLVGNDWIRKYPCTYCHNATTDAGGNISDKSKHINSVKDVVMSSQWAIVWDRGAPSYDSNAKVCNNVYCHSDGTTSDGTNYPEVRPFAWTEGRTECNTCHGHPQGSCNSAGCHDGLRHSDGEIWPIKTGWPSGQEWKGAMPMFPSTGAGTVRANSHPRHVEIDFTCDKCHSSTIKNGTCTTCHINGIPPGSMGEVAHIDPVYHVNKDKDVSFNDGGSYNPVSKTCSNTACHTGGVSPQWGGSVKSSVICLNCHGTAESDVDDFGSFNGTRAKINLTEWVTSGHGRPSSAGNYTSGNPAANFPGNPCWYCHDSKVLHKDDNNPFRLKQHLQFSNRFEKECVYCHMEGSDTECLSCHNEAGSLAPQLVSITNPPFSQDHSVYTNGLTSCVLSCHSTDETRHKTGAGLWSSAQKEDVKNQYLMMGVCLKCHDDESTGECTSCHTAPVDNPNKYSLGFDPGTGFIKPSRARASSAHFGYKHYQDFENTGGWTRDGNGKAINPAVGVWKGGKFCWDCHDPHGDSNIYMIQKMVATSTEGKFGKPLTRAEVVFTRKQTGLDYAKTSAPYNGICNVCHAAGSQHYRSDGGDGHNASRICTSCHEHKFSSSHSSGNACNTCHQNKPVPRHTAFGLPRDCLKCHSGVIGKRMDITGQFKGNSHHVQGVEISNMHCYACHWESTAVGLIDVNYHSGYNYKTHTSVKDAASDLVIWGAGTRPTTYQLGVTAETFLASRVGTVNERAEVTKLTPVCLSCHSDQNNDTTPFNDCRTPRQYAWDRQSIATRFSQLGTTTWGKYSSSANAAQKNIAKSYSAHGNAVANNGGWSATTGLDSVIPNTRAGSQNVQCFDCHSSHGSKVTGTTSSYKTFNGTKNGGNLKETQAGKGGYAMTYKASASASGKNPYNAGAAQCFDCHETANSGMTPWGYNSTYGATEAIIGYKDGSRFGTSNSGSKQRFSYRAGLTNKGGHLSASSPLSGSVMGTIDGLCTPCHDPHGVSPTLGTDQQYAVPLLKGTWLTSPYKEDYPAAAGTGVAPTWKTDRNTFGGSRVNEKAEQFAGLCLNCHAKSSLTDGVNKNTAFQSMDRVHETVKGWGSNAEHSYTCSKCHVPHNSGLPRLLQTNCLDSKHKGQVASGGAPSGRDIICNATPANTKWWGFPKGSSQNMIMCHSDHVGRDNVGGSGAAGEKWNGVSQW